MHAYFAPIVLAVYVSSAAGVLDECPDYKPFKTSWICPSEKSQFLASDINRELINDHTGQSNRQTYLGDKYVPGTKECVTDEARPEPVIPTVPTRFRKIELNELCKMRKVPIWNVFKDLNIEGRQRRLECIVVDTHWMHQDLYYAECVNPLTPTHDKCQLDYGSRDYFRCIQSGFVKKRVLLFCPEMNNYVFTTHKVPTTCSCRKCYHCEKKNLAFADLLGDLDTPLSLFPF